MEWLAENWFFVLLLVAMVAMHLFGHGHGDHSGHDHGHRGHSGHAKPSRTDAAPTSEHDRHETPGPRQHRSGCH